MEHTQYHILKIKILTANIEHEATTSKISEEQLFYCNQRGLNQEEAVSLIVNGFCKEVLAAITNGICSRGAKISRN